MFLGTGILPRHSENMGENYRNVACYVSPAPKRSTSSKISDPPKNHEEPVQSGFSYDFHKYTQPLRTPFNCARSRDSAKIALPCTFPQPDKSSTAPFLLHPPVNPLQSIENSQVTAAAFSLTPEMKRVKTQSFFDSF